MPIEFIAGLIIGISLGIDLTLFIQHIKELKNGGITNENKKC